MDKDKSKILASSQAKSPGIHKTLGILVAIFVAAKIVLLILAPKPAARASDLTIQNILEAVNQQRSLRNLIILNTDSRLSVAGQSKADDMQARHYFAHVDPDGNYIWPKITAAGYGPYLQLGENLAIEFYDTDSLISAWMNSPTHRANLLNDGFKDQGMGLSFGDSNSGQYHSAVANTFGTLLVKKTQTPLPQNPAPANPQPAQPKPPVAPAPIIKPAPEPQPVVPTFTTPSTTIPAPTPATTTGSTVPIETPPLKPVNPRGGDFALAGEAQEKPSQTTVVPVKPLPNPEPAQQSSAPAVINKQSSTQPWGFAVNRYFSLSFGAVLFLFLLSDLQGADPDNIKIKAKKINNMALLFIALVVIAIMYWL